MDTRPQIIRLSRVMARLLPGREHDQPGSPPRVLIGQRRRQNGTVTPSDYLVDITSNRAVKLILPQQGATDPGLAFVADEDTIVSSIDARRLSE